MDVLACSVLRSDEGVEVMTEPRIWKLNRGTDARLIVMDGPPLTTFSAVEVRENIITDGMVERGARELAERTGREWRDCDQGVWRGEFEAALRAAIEMPND
jgi:hypothetical protein